MKICRSLSFPFWCFLLVNMSSFSIGPDASALPRDRAAGRQQARYDRRTGQGYMAPADRAAGRSASRARRRAYHGLPAGAAPYRYGGYSYYRAGGRYYYPYVHGGRTVYVDVNVVNGKPAPPPPAGSVEIYF